MTIMGSNPRARVNEKHPEAFAICDRCGFLYNHINLQWQHEWRGNKLANIRWLVCKPCYDKPFENNRPIKLPPDPQPVKDARPPQWASQAGNPPPGPPVPVQQTIPDD